ncbi:hypothetical protein PVAP13_7KG091263 [Panicum virgatum]|uniref:Uncharacterized protein n=1 Tax=Panicum virgatum TaxID=38727 RepID=A0A8T0QJB8_PANVG|nr:hypothetical protein PVAP13_7KG091263 [Panicum virgatum]
MSDDSIQELNCFSNQKIPWVPFRVYVAMPVPALHFSSPQAPITFRFCPIFQLANTHIIGTPAAARQKWSTKLQMLSYSIPRIITNIALPAGNQASINNKQKITAYKLL